MYVLIGTKIKMNFHSIPLPLKLHMLMQRLLIRLSIKGIEDMESNAPCFICKLL